MKTPMELRYDKLGPRVAKALEGRFFEAWYFSEPGEAVEKSVLPYSKDGHHFLGRFHDYGGS